jgi:hypothetical protein
LRQADHAHEGRREQRKRGHDPVGRAGGDGIGKPAKGWTAYFVELTFGKAAPLKVTTGVRVIPDIKPFKYKQPTAPR